MRLATRPRPAHSPLEERGRGEALTLALASTGTGPARLLRRGRVHVLRRPPHALSRLLLRIRCRVAGRLRPDRRAPRPAISPPSAPHPTAPRRTAAPRTAAPHSRARPAPPPSLLPLSIPRYPSRLLRLPLPPQAPRAPASSWACSSSPRPTRSSTRSSPPCARACGTPPPSSSCSSSLRTSDRRHSHTRAARPSGNAHTVASRHTQTKLGIGDTAHRWIAHPITHPL